MANLFQYTFSIAQVTLIIVSVLFVGAGAVLANLGALKREMCRTFPEDGLPYRHYTYRRRVGVAYMVTGLLAASSLFVDSPYGLAAWGAVIAAANSVFTTAVLLTLIYASRRAFRILMAEVVLLAALVAVALFVHLPAEILRPVCIAVAAAILVADVVIYIRSRQRYLRTMFGLIGDEAMDYTKGGMKYMVALSLALSAWAVIGCLLPAAAPTAMLVSGFGVYYFVLGLYYRSHAFGSAVVEETMAKGFEWRRVSDRHWCKMVNDC